MEIERKEKSYMSGGDDHLMRDGFDYMLFRQDWNGSERVYFDRGEVDKVYDMISEGEILIHRNYSIVYCKSADLMGAVEDFGCYSMVVGE